MKASPLLRLKMRQALNSKGQEEFSTNSGGIDSSHLFESVKV